MNCSSAKKETHKLVAVAIAITSVCCIGALTNLDAFAKLLYSDGCLTAAIGCYQFMTGTASALGIRDLRIANAYTELSLCYSKVPRWTDAIRTQEKAISIRSGLQGAQHPSVLLLQANLARYKTESGDYKGAEALLNGLLAIGSKRHPPELYSQAYILGALEDCYLAQKKFAEAESIARQLIDVDDTLMVNLGISFSGRERLAEAYAKEGRLADAEAAAQEAVLVKEHLLQPDNASLGYAHEVLGKVFILEKQDSRARQEFGKALQTVEAKYGRNDVKVQYTRARYDHLMVISNPFNADD